MRSFQDHFKLELVKTALSFHKKITFKNVFQNVFLSKMSFKMFKQFVLLLLTGQGML